MIMNGTGPINVENDLFLSAVAMMKVMGTDIVGLKLKGDIFAIILVGYQHFIDKLF